jgi:hypothetical protein
LHCEFEVPTPISAVFYFSPGGCYAELYNLQAETYR